MTFLEHDRMLHGRLLLLLTTELSASRRYTIFSARDRMALFVLFHDISIQNEPESVSWMDAMIIYEYHGYAKLLHGSFMSPEIC